MSKSQQRPRIRLNQHHHRVKLDWEPQWEPEIRNWASKIIRENKWRYDPIHDHADLLQDAYVKFLMLKETYPRVIQPQHFMSLYKRALVNQLCDEANKNISRKETFIQTESDPDILADEVVKELDNEGYLIILLNEAPADIRAVFELFNDDGKLEELRKPYFRPYKGLSPRESLNERLCSLIDVDYFTTSGRKRIRVKYDLVERIKGWLSEQPIGRKEALDHVRD